MKAEDKTVIPLHFTRLWPQTAFLQSCDAKTMPSEKHTKKAALLLGEQLDLHTKNRVLKNGVRTQKMLTQRS